MLCSSIAQQMLMRVMTKGTWRKKIKFDICFRLLYLLIKLNVDYRNFPPIRKKKWHFENFFLLMNLGTKIKS